MCVVSCVICSPSITLCNLLSGKSPAEKTVLAASCIKHLNLPGASSCVKYRKYCHTLLASTCLRLLRHTKLFCLELQKRTSGFCYECTRALVKVVYSICFGRPPIPCQICNDRSSFFARYMIINKNILEF